MDKYRDTGLLLLRIGIGIMFMIHGYPKIMGGVEKWTALGNNLGSLNMGIPVFWGFMAAFAEFFGGLLLIFGLFFRFINLLLLITMLVAVAKHVEGGDGFSGYSHAAESAILFFSLMFIGPGRFSIDQNLNK
ncbi:MAG: DoxX family protein [Sphingobacteriales bacterium]|nr:MAG: DoxX family protein [Sphingobacteriales bacterium]